MSNEAAPPMHNDPHRLARFLVAQADSYKQALQEIRAGRKRSHWMWYIFPQYHGLGFSSMSQRYAIHSPEEAAAFLSHPVLSQRLTECAQATVAVEGKTAHEIFGSPDDLKLQSSATLFAHFSPIGSIFEELLDRFYDGQRDEKTRHLLRTDEKR